MSVRNYGPLGAALVTVLAGALALSVAACSKSQPREEGSPTSAAAEAQDRDAHAHEHGHGDHHARSFDDPESYAERWNHPERDAWQRPDLVIEAMEIEEGMAVADLGAGTGYFIPHLAEAVGDEGVVYAVDIEEEMLRYIDEMVEELGLDNVETVKAEASSSNLEEASVDRILTVNTWHHIPERGEYSRHLRERLQAGGSVWVVDFTKDSPTGPPAEHRLEPDSVARELEAGGLRAELRELDLDRQFVVVGAAD